MSDRYKVGQFTDEGSFFVDKAGLMCPCLDMLVSPPDPLQSGLPPKVFEQMLALETAVFPSLPLGTLKVVDVLARFGLMDAEDVTGVVIDNNQCITPMEVDWMNVGGRRGAGPGIHLKHPTSSVRQPIRVSTRREVDADYYERVRVKAQESVEHPGTQRVSDGEVFQCRRVEEIEGPPVTEVNFGTLMVLLSPKLDVDMVKLLDAYWVRPAEHGLVRSAEQQSWLDTFLGNVEAIREGRVPFGMGASEGHGRSA